MCSICDEFDIEIQIHGPEQLQRLMNKVKDAIANKKLSYNSFESDRALIGQASFLKLDIDESLPDVIRYYFDCENCRNVFALIVETYHGQGGTWCRLGSIDT